MSVKADNGRLARFSLAGRVAVVTGGAGLLGPEHAAALAEAGATPVLWDINGELARDRAEAISNARGGRCLHACVDVTDEDSIKDGLKALLDATGRIDVLVNNAANDAKVDAGGGIAASRLENFPLAAWNRDIAVGLTGAFLCARVVGGAMAAADGGVILNVASDLGIVAPDQRIYRQDGLSDDRQPAKPVTYSVVKHGVIGLTRYLATYWCDRGVRVNALCPGGVRTDQPDDFVERLTNLIPLGRMADVDEYRGAIQFLCSDASSYMTGACLSIDGGRTCW